MIKISHFKIGRQKMNIFLFTMTKNIFNHLWDDISTSSQVFQHTNKMVWKIHPLSAKNNIKHKCCQKGDILQHSCFSILFFFSEYTNNLTLIIQSYQILHIIIFVSFCSSTTLNMTKLIK